MKTFPALPLIMILVEPVSSILMAFLILGEELAPALLFGGALILGANIMVETPLKKARNVLGHLTVKIPVAKPLEAKGVKEAHELAVMRHMAHKYRARLRSAVSQRG